MEDRAKNHDVQLTKARENTAKNRYADILPYDDARVHLEVTVPGSDDDYINASHLKVVIFYMFYKRPIVSSYIGNPAWSRRKRLYLLARADRGYSGRFLENGHATKLKDNSDGHKSRGTRETKMRSILATSSWLVLYSLAFYSNITLIKVNRPILRPPSGDTP